MCAQAVSILFHDAASPGQVRAFARTTLQRWQTRFSAQGKAAHPAARDHVHHAGHGVRSVTGGGTVGEDFDLVDRRQRHEVQIHHGPFADDGLAAVIGQTPPVEQYQRPALSPMDGGRFRSTFAGPRGHTGFRKVLHHRQALHKAAQVRGPALRDVTLCQHLDGQGLARLFGQDRRACDFNLVELTVGGWCCDHRDRAQGWNGFRSLCMSRIAQQGQSQDAHVVQGFHRLSMFMNT